MKTYSIIYVRDKKYSYRIYSNKYIKKIEFFLGEDILYKPSVIADIVSNDTMEIINIIETFNKYLDNLPKEKS